MSDVAFARAVDNFKAFIKVGLAWALIFGVGSGIKKYFWEDAPIRECESEYNTSCQWQAVPMENHDG